MESLLRLYLQAMAQGREQFVRANRGVYIVKRPSLIDCDRDDIIDEELHTELIAGRDTDATELRHPSVNEWTVAQVKKRPGYPPFSRVSVGRARICDVVCQYASISKVHAQFHLEDFLPVAIADQGSANGTFLNGRRLSPQDAAPVAVGDRIRLGEADFELLDSDKLYDLLRSQM